MTEPREAHVTGPDRTTTGRWMVPSEPPWRLALVVGDRTYSAEETDLFRCLLSIRVELEREGLQVCCAGALPDVWPSGMAAQMGGGRKAYRLSRGRHSTRADLVDVFDHVDCADVVTVAEQERTVRSLRG